VRKLDEGQYRAIVLAQRANTRRLGNIALGILQPEVM
jgi:hypothetical protein